MLCRNCNTEQLWDAPQGLKVPPKVLYFDIETSLSTWENFGRRVPSTWMRPEQMVNDWYVICWSACWVEDGINFIPVLSGRVREDEAQNRDDKRTLTELWNLLEVADYWVGHNSDKFDVKKSNYRFIRNGLNLPYKSKQLDTLKMARKYFAADSNKLDEWARIFGGDGKKHMEYEDWSRINRDPRAVDLQKMEDYCRQDVREGAELFREFKRLIELRGDVLVK